jgi:hypothetical protein
MIINIAYLIVSNMKLFKIYIYIDDNDKLFIIYYVNLKF